jgi:hypothetical protein
MSMKYKRVFARLLALMIVGETALRGRTFDLPLVLVKHFEPVGCPISEGDYLRLQKALEN